LQHLPPAVEVPRRFSTATQGGASGRKECVGGTGWQLGVGMEEEGAGVSGFGIRGLGLWFSV